MSWEAKPKVELTVGILHTGTVSMEWTLNFAQLFAHLQATRRFYLAHNRGFPWDIARSTIVDDALKIGSEWLLFVDSDCLVPHDIFDRLVSKNLPVISALYYRRHKPLHPAMWKLVPEKGICPECNREMERRGMKGKYSPIVDYPRGQIIEADVVGCGALLIHRRVLEATHHPPEDPLFVWTAKREATLTEKVLSHVVGGVGTSEDFFGAERIKEAGYKIYVATDVIVPHETQVKIVPPEQMNPDDVKWGGIQFPGV